MKKKKSTIVLVLDPVKPRRHFAPATKVLPDKKKEEKRKECRK